MSAESICDGCEKREEMFHNGRNWYKPSTWFERSDDDGIQIACSRECIEKISNKTGKTSLVLPI